MPQNGPVTLFLSYTHEDEPFCQEFKKHLRLLERQNLLSAWYDRQVTAGDNWSEEIDKQLEQAGIIALLISADFLSSNYCYSVEMEQAIARHKAGEAKVISIPIRPCDWRSHDALIHLQVLPTNARPISTWQNRDEAWTNVVTGIRRVLEPSSPQRDRAQFLAILHDSYHNHLHASLEGEDQIALTLHKRPNALPNQMHVRQPHQSEHPLPAGTTLLQVFDNTSGVLLVLGHPGAGKTTLLLNQAEALYQRAIQDEHALIPVIVNLSTWTTTHKPLSEWLIEEIIKSYGVPFSSNYSILVVSLI